MLICSGAVQNSSTLFCVCKIKIPLISAKHIEIRHSQSGKLAAWKGANMTDFTVGHPSNVGTALALFSIGALCLLGSLGTSQTHLITVPRQVNTCPIDFTPSISLCAGFATSCRFEGRLFQYCRQGHCPHREPATFARFTNWLFSNFLQFFPTGSIARTSHKKVC